VVDNSFIMCCRMDPLWNSLVIGGLQADKEGELKPFLGFIGMIGTHYEDAHIATGVQWFWSRTKSMSDCIHAVIVGLFTDKCMFNTTCSPGCLAPIAQA